MAARPEHKFDPVPFAAWLKAALPELGPLRSVVQIEGGQSNPTFRLRCDPGEAVLRKKPPGALLPSAHRIDREWKFLQALGSMEPPAVPVPRALAWGEDASLLGTVFYVMDWVEGRTFDTPALSGLDRSARGRVFEGYFRTLGRLHSVRPESIGLGNMGRPQGYVKRQTARWTAQYEASATRTVREMDLLCKTLAGWTPPEDRASIVHGDYRFANVIFAPDFETVNAVLDWELATLGHPLADLAFACVAFRCAPDTPGFPGVHGLARAPLGIPSESDALEVYCSAGAEIAPGNWNYWIAHAFFRLAAISQGIFRRGIDGQASSTNWRIYGPAVATLARLGMEALE